MRTSAEALQDALIEAPGGGALELIARLAAQTASTEAGAVCIRSHSGWTNATCGLGPEWRNCALPGADEASCTGKARAFALPASASQDFEFAAGYALDSGPCRVVLLVLSRSARAPSAAELGALDELRAALVRAIVLCDDDTGCAAAADLSFSVDLSWRITAIRNGRKWTGYGEQELIGRELFALVPENEREQVRDDLVSRLGGAPAGTSLFAIQARLGPALRLTYRSRLLFDRGRPVGLELTCDEVKQSEDPRHHREDMDRVTGGRDSRFARFSERVRHLYRLDLPEHCDLLDTCLRYLREGCELFQWPMGRILSGEGHVIAAYPPPGPDHFVAGTSAPLVLGSTRLGTVEFGTSQAGWDAEPHQNPEDRDLMELFAHSLTLALRAAQLEQEHNQIASTLEFHQRRDSLTGLPNRLALFEWLFRALARARGTKESIAVSVIDLDRFKQVNQTFGHAAGDLALKRLASRIGRWNSDHGIACRLGGDEFAVAFAGRLGHDEIQSRMEDLAASVERPIRIEDRDLVVTASMGVALAPDDAMDPPALLRLADTAMLQAKLAGRAGYCFYRPEMTSRSVPGLELEIELRHALANNELRLRYQPILDLRDTGLSVEALLDWQSPKLGRLGPNQFIGVAEECGLIAPIGRWVLEQACRQSTLWRKLGLGPVRISVNVSAIQFSRPDFVDSVVEALEQAGMRAEYLELELTESMILPEIDESIARMNRIRQLGVSLSIDDFGTGYSSLNYLRRLPVDSLKIDRSFVADLSHSGTSQPLAQTIVVLAHNLGLTVIAEGVETEQQFQLLQGMGCDKVQGHLFGFPVPAEAIPGVLGRNRRAWAHKDSRVRLQP